MAVPVEIYSDTFLLYSGMDLPLEDLWEKLRHLGYTISRSVPKRSGEHRFLKREGILEIYLHDLTIPQNPSKILSTSRLTRMTASSADMPMHSRDITNEIEILEPPFIPSISGQTFSS